MCYVNNTHKYTIATKSYSYDAMQIIIYYITSCAERRPLCRYDHVNRFITCYRIAHVRYFGAHMQSKKNVEKTFVPYSVVHGIRTNF